MNHHVGGHSGEDGMELRLIDSHGLPAGSLVSIRVGAIRRQAMLNSNRPYRFSDCKGKQQMKVDIYAPIAHARLLIDPCEARVNLELDPPPQAVGEAPISNMFNSGCYGGRGNMNLDFEVGPISKDGRCDEGHYSDGGGFVPGDKGSNVMNYGARREQVKKEAQPYFEQHSLIEVMQTLLQAVIKEKPVDPYGYMIRVLQNSAKAAQGKRSNRPHSASPRTGPGSFDPKELMKGSRQRPASAHPKSQHMHGHRFSGGRMGGLMEGFPSGPDGMNSMDEYDYDNYQMGPMPVGSARNVIREYSKMGGMGFNQMPHGMHGFGQHYQNEAMYQQNNHMGGFGQMPGSYHHAWSWQQTPYGNTRGMMSQKELAAGLTPPMPPAGPHPGFSRGPRPGQHFVQSKMMHGHGNDYSMVQSSFDQNMGMGGAPRPEKVEEVRRNIREGLMEKAQRGDLAQWLDQCIQEEKINPCGQDSNYNYTHYGNSSHMMNSYTAFGGTVTSTQPQMYGMYGKQQQMYGNNFGNSFGNNFGNNFGNGVGNSFGNNFSNNFGNAEPACGTELEKLRARLRDGLSQAADMGTLPRLLQEAERMADQRSPSPHPPATLSNARGGVSKCGTGPAPPPGPRGSRPQPRNMQPTMQSQSQAHFAPIGVQPPPPGYFGKGMLSPPPGYFDGSTMPPPGFNGMTYQNYHMNQHGSHFHNEMNHFRGEMDPMKNRTEQLEDMVQRLINENNQLRDGANKNKFGNNPATQYCQSAR